jgi:hypothetical protein
VGELENQLPPLDTRWATLTPGDSGEYAIVPINAAGQSPQSDPISWTQPV